MFARWSTHAKLLVASSQVKRHLKLAHLNVALADSVLPSDKATADSVKAASLEHMVSTVAICAGSGRSVLGGVKAGTAPSTFCCVFVCHPPLFLAVLRKMCG